MNHRFCSIALFTLLILAPTVSRGADLLADIPSDALGFVLVHNLSSADTKIAQLGTLLQRNIPRPLEFLKEFAGIAEGINADGDCMLAVLPGSGGNEESLQFCVWLPVTDYDRFLNSLGATSIDGVAAATIAGEDLLVAHRGDWALLMNADQRQRISAVASASPSTPQMPRWNKWIEANDVTVVAFSPGVRALVSSIDGEDADQEDADSAEANGPQAAPNQPPNRRVIVSSRESISDNCLRARNRNFRSGRLRCQNWLKRCTRPMSSVVACAWTPAATR